jgi:putative transposase
VRNQRWILDISEQFIDGRRLRILVVVVEDCTRECLALVADTSISGFRVARELDMAERGKPGTIVSDYGTELNSNAILRWEDDHKVAWHYIGPGSPYRSLRRVRADCATSCSTRHCSDQSRMRAPLDAWRTDYNTEGPILGSAG